MTTRIYLDIDGVINSLSKSAPKMNTQWLGEWGQEKVIGYPILWSLELIDHLNDIAIKEDVQFVILSTWQDHAINDLAPVVNLNATDTWDVLYPENQEDLYSFQNGWWKLHAIKKDVELYNPDKIIWLDDDISFESPAIKWITEQAEKILSICPYSTHGLTKKHIHDIINFIEVE